MGGVWPQEFRDLSRYSGELGAKLTVTGVCANVSGLTPALVASPVVLQLCTCSRNQHLFSTLEKH